MRIALFAAMVWCGNNALACGGGHADGEGAKSPAEGMNAVASPATGEDAGNATTTTALGEEHEAPGRKLDETRSPQSSPAAPPSSAQTAVAPHTHDTGRRPADIRAMIVAHRDQARACYDHSLAAHPGIEGDLVMQWTIDPKGNVTQVSTDSSRSQIAEPTVTACVAELIKTLQFAASPGGFETKAFYPFNFHPRHGARPSADGGL